MAILLTILAGCYAIFTFILWQAWSQTINTSSIQPNHEEDRSLPFISVVIPVRNEATNLPALFADLNCQTYSHFEVIIADDASTDNTLQVIQAAIATSPFPLHVLSLANDASITSPKKRAISQSIVVANGTLIVTTDGDCRVGPQWLASFAQFYGQTGARLITGPVTFATDPGLFASLQTVEFASLIGSGAATLALGFPTMCNGANLCYEKRVFTEVGGFAGVDHIASGDDELLMHKIAAHYPDGVRFLKNSLAIVQTAPHHSLSAFYQQRKRWASKWRAYSSPWPTLLAVFVFMSNMVPIVTLAGWLASWWSGWYVLGIVLLKNGPEVLFLRSVLVFLQKRNTVIWILITQLIYPFYVIFFGLAAQRSGFIWKGRRLN